MCSKHVLKSISSLQLGFNFTLKDSKCETSLSLLFIFVYNKLVIVITECKLFLLCNTFATKDYVTKFTSE